MTQTTKHFIGRAKGHRPLLAKGRKAVKAVSLDVTGVLVGRSAWTGEDGMGVSVYYDQQLVSDGPEICQDVLSRIDSLMAWCDDAFQSHGDSGNVVVTDTGTNGGAYHAACAFNATVPDGSDWYEAPYYLLPGALWPAGLTFGLVMAEVCESYMGLQAAGWPCGGSSGEALSRVLANMVCGGSGGALFQAGFGSAPSYDGSDWISRDQGTDGDYASIGCGVLYLYWMLSQGHTIQEIIQAGCPKGTLASNWEALTTRSADQAFALFRTALKPFGPPSSWASDNPFAGVEPVYPPVTPTPVANAVTLDGTLPAGTYPLLGAPAPSGTVTLTAQQWAAILALGEQLLALLTGIMGSRR